MEAIYLLIVNDIWSMPPVYIIMTIMKCSVTAVFPVNSILNLRHIPHVVMITTLDCLQQFHYVTKTKLNIISKSSFPLKSNKTKK